MVTPRAFAVALLLIGPVLAAAFPEPLILYNLTMEEFHARRWEYRKRSLSARAEASVDQHTIHLNKRYPFEREDLNRADQQVLVEELSEQCAKEFGEKYRASYGYCQPRGSSMTVHCKHMSKRQEKGLRMGHKCEDDEKCRGKKVYNFMGNHVTMTWCAIVIDVDRKKTTVDVASIYDGKATLPDEVWSPGTLDTFWELDANLPGLTGDYEYHGNFKSGKKFSAQSPKDVSSWCCMGCPPGRLSISTMAFKGQAVGMTVPSWVL